MPRCGGGAVVHVHTCMLSPALSCTLERGGKVVREAAAISAGLRRGDVERVGGGGPLWGRLLDGVLRWGGSGRGRLLTRHGGVVACEIGECGGER